MSGMFSDGVRYRWWLRYMIESMGTRDALYDIHDEHDYEVEEMCTTTLTEQRLLQEDHFIILLSS